MPLLGCFRNVRTCRTQAVVGVELSARLPIQVSSAGGLAKWPAPYGDWVPADANTKVSNSLCAAYNYIVNVKEAAQLATALNNSKDAATLTQVRLFARWQ